jgi:hypothetical protein
MAVTREQLDSFHDFAAAQIENGGSALSLEQLLDLWRIANPTPEERAANVAAIQQALDDMVAGDTGEPAADVLRDLRTALNVATHDQ